MEYINLRKILIDTTWIIFFISFFSRP